MSTTYKVLQGDTFDTISRKVSGIETNAATIAKANPGTSEPLQAGTSLTIPDLTGGAALGGGPAAGSDEVAILIGGQRFRFWETIRITRALDRPDTVQFSAPFQSNDSEYRKQFKPLSYKGAVVSIGGETLFKGTMLTVEPQIQPNRKTLAIGCYALPGVLFDCTPPASGFPYEFDGQGLKEIAETLCAPFGIRVQFDAEQGAVFERVALSPGKTVGSFLTSLAKQRNLILSSTASGALKVYRPALDGQPVASIKQGEPPFVSAAPSFNPQQYFSHITGIEPATIGLTGSQFTVKNELLDTSVRPHTYTEPDTLDADMQSAVNAKASRMLAGAVSYEVEVSTWRDPSGKVWEPSKFLTLEAADAMVYNAYKMLIKSVELTRDRKTETAKLSLVLPGAYSGKLPESLPWD